VTRSEQAGAGAADVEERHREQGHRLGAVRHEVGGLGEGVEVAVAEHHALRHPGRAGRVELQHDGVVVLRCLWILGRRGGQPGFVLLAGLDDPHVGAGGRRRREGGERSAAGDHQPGTAVGHDHADLGRGQPQVDRGRDGTGLDRAEQHLEELDAVAVQDEHALTRLDSRGEQRLRDPARALVQLVVAALHPTADEGGARPLLRVDLPHQRTHPEAHGRTLA
jgi:hypothetical protein